MLRFHLTHESTDDAQVEGTIVPVLPRVGGYVERVLVQENQPVREGQVLVELDPADLEIRVAQAESAVREAEVGAGAQAPAHVSDASSRTGALDAQIEAARANAERAERDLTRMEELAAKHIVSSQRLDAARTAAETSRAAVRSLERQKSAARAGVTSARAGVDVAGARLEAARATLRSARLQLSYTRITAPASGVVARRSVEPGQLVQPGQPLMALVADTAWVTANFKETQLTRIHEGAEVEVAVDAYPGCTVRGRVASVSPATGSQFSLLPPDNATGNFTKVVQRVPVRIRIVDTCGPDRPLRPGMSVTAHVAIR